MSFQLKGSTQILEIHKNEILPLKYTWFTVVDSGQGVAGNERDLSSGWTGTLYVRDAANTETVWSKSITSGLGAGVDNIDATMLAVDTNQAALVPDDYIVILKLNDGTDDYIMPDRGGIQLKIIDAL